MTTERRLTNSFNWYIWRACGKCQFPVPTLQDKNQSWVLLSCKPTVQLRKCLKKAGLPRSLGGLRRWGVALERQVFEMQALSDGYNPKLDLSFTEVSGSLELRCASEPLEMQIWNWVVWDMVLNHPWTLF